MATIQSKKKPILQKGSGLVYDETTFNKHVQSFIIETEDPQEILDNIVPYEFEGMKLIVVDTETHPQYRNSSVVPKDVVRRWVGTGKTAKPQDYPFCLQICDGVRAYVIYDSIENDFKKFKALAPLLEDMSVDKIAHNVKFDMHMIANAKCKLKGRMHDTVVLAKLADENRSSFELKEIAAKLPKGIVAFEYMLANYKDTHKISDYRHFPRKLMTQYGGCDVWNAFQEFITDYKKLQEDDLITLYNNECEMTMALYAMERFGFKVDVSYEQPLKEELQELVDNAERSIYDKAGTVFNINSTKQLYDVLIKTGTSISWIPTTPKGNPSLSKDVLNTLANRYDVGIVKDILDYRKYEKLLGTYAIGIYEQKDSVDVVHGNINQTEATTGRMSITKPALQTLPKKDKRIRRAFIPDDDYQLWFMDLDQIEYRLFSHYAKIQNLLEAIDKGHDVHGATAAMLYHKNLDELLELVKQDDEEANALRSKAKTVNFALTTIIAQVKFIELLGSLDKVNQQLRPA